MTLLAFAARVTETSTRCEFRPAGPCEFVLKAIGHTKKDRAVGPTGCTAPDLRPTAIRV